LFVPAKFGGYEVDPITFVKIIEEISAVDGSAGWVVSVCAVGGLFAGFLREERCFRDVHVAMQHVAVSSTSLELAGRVILGLDPGTARF
jgi:hypothetical protein